MRLHIMVGGAPLRVAKPLQPAFTHTCDSRGWAAPVNVQLDRGNNQQDGGRNPPHKLEADTRGRKRQQREENRERLKRKRKRKETLSKGLVRRQ